MLVSELNSYVLLQMVGNTGTFGFYRRRSDEAVVAVQTFLTEDRKQRGREEAEILGSLLSNAAHNNHIVRLYEALPDEHFHIVQEALDWNLVEFMNFNRVNKFKIRDIRTILRQVLAASARMKEVGIVHSRIKLENLKLVDHARQPFQVKLIGFDAALDKRAAVYEIMHRPLSSSVSAPEELLGCPCSSKIDMWSVGCMAAEMALGRTLFPCERNLELVHHIFGTRGLPPAAMLDSGIKTKRLFDKVPGENGADGWQLKSYRRTRSQRIRSWMGQRPAKLKDLEAKNQLEHGSRRHKLAELQDRRCLGHLLDSLLAVDPEQRIDPDRALHHPFFTLQHLRDPAYEAYYNCSQQAYQDAGVSAPQDLPPGSWGSFEETITQRRPSLRRRLRSLFARIFICGRRKRPAAADAENLSASATDPAPQSTDRDEQESADDGGQCSSVDEPQTGSDSSTAEVPAEPHQRRAGFLRRWIQRVWGRRSAATEDIKSQ